MCQYEGASKKSYQALVHKKSILEIILLFIPANLTYGTKGRLEHGEELSGVNLFTTLSSRRQKNPSSQKYCWML